MAPDHRARPIDLIPPGGASPRGSRQAKPADEPVSRRGIAVRGAVVAVGLYLVWLGVQGSPFPGNVGGDDHGAWREAGPGAWTAYSVVVLATGLLAVLVGSVALLSAVPVGGVGAAAFRTRLRARFDLIMFALVGALFTVALVVLAVLWSTGVAVRTYEVEDAIPDGAMYAILIAVCALVAGIGLAMVVSLVRGPARPVPSGERLPMSRLILRPFGYLAVGTVWVALWLIILAISAALPVALSDRRPIGLAEGPLSAAEGIVSLTESPLELIAVLLLLGPVLAALFGWVLGMFPFTSWPLAALSFVYVARSLRPSYATEPLSGTSYSADTIGPVKATETALSLLPVRRSRLTDALTKAYFIGWTPSFAMILSCFWLGLGYLVAVVVFTWPVTNAVAVVAWSVICLALAGYSVYRLVRLARGVPIRPVRERASSGNRSRRS